MICDREEHMAECTRTKIMNHTYTSFGPTTTTKIAATKYNLENKASKVNNHFAEDGRRWYRKSAFDIYKYEVIWWSRVLVFYQYVKASSIRWRQDTDKNLTWSYLVGQKMNYCANLMLCPMAVTLWKTASWKLSTGCTTHKSIYLTSLDKEDVTLHQCELWRTLGRVCGTRVARVQRQTFQPAYQGPRTCNPFCALSSATRQTIDCSLKRMALRPVFPLKKFYTEQMFVLLRTKRMQLRNHADTQTVKRSKR